MRDEPGFNLMLSPSSNAGAVWLVYNHLNGSELTFELKLVSFLTISKDFNQVLICCRHVFKNGLLMGRW